MRQTAPEPDGGPTASIPGSSDRLLRSRGPCLCDRWFAQELGELHVTDGETEVGDSRGSQTPEATELICVRADFPTASSDPRLFPALLVFVLAANKFLIR